MLQGVQEIQSCIKVALVYSVQDYGCLRIQLNKLHDKLTVFTYLKLPRCKAFGFLFVVEVNRRLKQRFPRS
jgi:hypothetical protein